jgi:hypothetical protein
VEIFCRILLYLCSRNGIFYYVSVVIREFSLGVNGSEVFPYHSRSHRRGPEGGVVTCGDIEGTWQAGGLI